MEVDTSLLNTILAILEDRPADARSILQGSLRGRIGFSAIHTRIHAALDAIKIRLELQVLKELLLATMSLQPPEGVDEEAYFQGVQDAETVVADRLKMLLDLQKQVQAGRPSNPGQI